jgi:hypothetical protein
MSRSGAGNYLASLVFATYFLTFSAFSD